MKLEILTLVKYSLIYVYDLTSNDPQLFQPGSTLILTVALSGYRAIG